jgi:KipI family sensor histidine kinase inhibitor
MIELRPFGDRAFLATFESESEAKRWVSEVKKHACTGVTEVVLAYASAAVFTDPDQVNFVDVETQLRSVVPPNHSDKVGILIELPVLYDGEDLAGVARALGFRVEEVVALHSGTDYDVFAIGFIPGFPYAGYLPDELRGLPRRPSPRTNVPAGSVAIAGKQTGVYPHESPGGWHLIGRTPLTIANVADGHFPIRAGDRLRFVPITLEEYSARQGERLDGTPR